ncbi:hypothetical protein CHARACLAT_001189 [Characodon lateralis]|uniref:Uncharacterized protein n=1 Tax=Characodon lateralis TaxID=208331 RepID=A0ABU7E650_9TELE|nr:hypothetical protein [Characodon lateralis]
MHPFPCLLPGYCVQVLPMRENGIAKPVAGNTERGSLCMWSFSQASSSWKTGEIQRLRWMRANYAMPTIDNQKYTSETYLPDTLFHFKMQRIFGRKNGFPVFQ